MANPWALEGHHRVTRTDCATWEETLHRAGLYALHHDPTRGDKRGDYAITHVPTGMRVMAVRTEELGRLAVEQWNNACEDAGGRWSFGFTTPSKSDPDYVRMEAAHRLITAYIRRAELALPVVDEVARG